MTSNKEFFSSSKSSFDLTQSSGADQMVPSTASSHIDQNQLKSNSTAASTGNLMQKHIRKILPQFIISEEQTPTVQRTIGLSCTPTGSD